MYQHILIATDGSEVAQKGVDEGINLAKALGAAVTFVTVSEVLPYVGRVSDVTTFDYYREYENVQKAAAERVLAEATDAARSASVKADKVYFGQGSPAQAILETAKDRNCDLIVMASHGRRGLRRMVLGSVATEVLSLSSISVLVVR